MKKEAVTRRPIASMETASTGYKFTGTGLAIGCGAFKKNTNKKSNKVIVHKRKIYMKLR